MHDLRGWKMLVMLVVLVAVVWVLTAVDVVRRRALSRGGRVAWVAAASLVPFFAIPAYWAVRPLGRRREPRRANQTPQTLADLIPGWTVDRADACEQADAWARDGSRQHPAPGFYAWLRDSGLAEKYPACAARLVRTLLGSEERRAFAACVEAAALTALLEDYVGDADDLRAIKEQLGRLCPGSLRAAQGSPVRGDPILS
jgi:hypothetical protein